MEKMIGYCGLNCAACEAHIATIGENGGYPPTKNGDIRSLLCA